MASRVALGFDGSRRALDPSLDSGFKGSTPMQLLGDNAPIIDLEILDQANGIESGIEGSIV
jgi:hypothetical protein